MTERKTRKLFYLLYFLYFLIGFGAFFPLSAFFKGSVDFANILQILASLGIGPLFISYMEKKEQIYAMAFFFCGAAIAFTAQTL